jgi:hypothetical protein
MVRAGDIFYPSHFPKRMEDSLGVDHSGVPRSTIITPYASPYTSDQILPQKRARSADESPPRSLPVQKASTGRSLQSRGSFQREETEEDMYKRQKMWKESGCADLSASDWMKPRSERDQLPRGGDF